MGVAEALIEIEGPRAVDNATGSPRNAASVLFDLPRYRVVSAVDLPGGGREVVIASVEGEAGCPTCGVLSGRVHQRTRQRLRDVPVAGHVRVVLIRRRFACVEQRCRADVRGGHRAGPGGPGPPPACRGSCSPRSWPGGPSPRSPRTGCRGGRSRPSSSAAALLGIDPDAASPRRLGIDEHRYRSVRYWRDEHGTWRRYEPWMSTIVDVDTRASSAWSTDAAPPGSLRGWRPGRRSGGTGSRSSRSTPLRRSAPPPSTSSAGGGQCRRVPPGQNSPTTP
ncbi:MAG: transposase family protein [Kineosporiaceae bacterium]